VYLPLQSHQVKMVSWGITLQFLLWPRWNICARLEEGNFFPCPSALPSCRQPEVESQNHRIIESLMLEKTSESMKSNHQPNPRMPAKPCPEVPYLHVFEAGACQRQGCSVDTISREAAALCLCPPSPPRQPFPVVGLRAFAATASTPPRLRGVFVSECKINRRLRVLRACFKAL